MKIVTRVALPTVALLILCGPAAAETVYFDNFNRASLNGGTSVYAVANHGGNGTASITSNKLALNGGNQPGMVYVTTPTSAFGSPFNQTLDALPDGSMVTWYMNMQQSRPDPTGFGPLQHGIAVVLGATSTNIANAGQGYAVYFGETGTWGPLDPIRLGRFDAGMAGSLTTILHDFTYTTTKHISVKVTFEPGTGTWTLYTREDGASFVDPRTGSYSLIGSMIDTTYTGQALTHFGALWNHNSTSIATFDNFSIDVVVPQTDPGGHDPVVVPLPAAVWAGGALLAAIGAWRGRKARRN